MKISIIVPTLDGKIPASVQALADRVEIVAVSGVRPVSAARNEGLRRATGDYIAWVDADDEILPDWLTEIERALASDPDRVTFDARVEWTDGSARPGYRLDGREAGQLWTKVFRRTLFAGLAFQGEIHEDWRMLCELPKPRSTVHIDRELYLYRRSATGLSQHRNLRGEIAALWGLVRICRDRKMLRGICERAWDLAKEPARRFCRGRAAPVRPADAAPVWLVDARTLGLRPTGIGMYAKRQLERLMRWNPKVRFVLVTDVKESEAIRALEAKGAEVRLYGTRVFNSIAVLGYFRFVKRVIAEIRPELFWQPNNLQPFRPRGVKRVVVTMHDVFGLKDWSWRYALWHLYYRLAFRRTLKNATELWFNSKVTEREVKAASPKLTAKLRCEVVYPIAEVPPRSEIASYPHPRPYFLYLGNIERRKGADILLAAWRQAGRPADLVFAGVEKNVKLPADAGITMLGYVDEATKFSLLASARALVVPSRAEGYGMQVAEAAALGVKCLASDLEVFREIYPAERTVFPAGEVAALAELLKTT